MLVSFMISRRNGIDWSGPVDSTGEEDLDGVTVSTFENPLPLLNYISPVTSNDAEQLYIDTRLFVQTHGV